ncbi:MULTISPECIES: aegerolysin family protein [unclassified Xenorhabdus]|uniref:aegerolysin family protein n=1 Tax=Xenorhabdus TaxID=626 RepID=UPI000C03A551|nr:MULTISPECIES: aegerolysin family protein [unclassified Xenorhabdus]MCC8379646.1 hypothetical protein [Xenorhabdus sp. PB30.3]PHM54387.1 hypothetical protein Xekk_02583 [Xenorhabdus sp. KK7.4]
MKRMSFRILIFLLSIFSFSVFSTHADPSARSADITIYNKTNKTLRISSMELFHGQWAHEPPYNIFSNSSGYFRSESNGFLTGTEGIVEYKFRDNSSTFTIHWDIPYLWILSNSYEINSSSASYKISREGGDHGNNVHVKITIENAAN